MKAEKDPSWISSLTVHAVKSNVNLVNLGNIKGISQHQSLLQFGNCSPLNSNVAAAVIMTVGKLQPPSAQCTHFPPNPNKHRKKKPKKRLPQNRRAVAPSLGKWKHDAHSLSVTINLSLSLTQSQSLTSICSDLSTNQLLNTATNPEQFLSSFSSHPSPTAIQ